MFSILQKYYKLGLLCCSRSLSSPGKSKKRRVPVRPVAAKKPFTLESPSATRPSFEVVLEKSFEFSGATRSGRNQCNTPVLHGVIHKSLIVYMYRFLRICSLVIV